jgi:soluble lytic murein transglycosylase-like protein
MSLIGLVIATLIAVLYVRPDLLSTVETRALSLLLQRQEARNDSPIPPVADNNAAERASATQPSLLPKPQASIALWLSRKYSVAPEPLSLLVAEAFAIGEKIKIDPTLILAVMAIESRFNPFAQSGHGAQGLMQVLTRVHTDKYELFGGTLAAFDPISNLRVGVKVLQDSIQRAGSVDGGLALYVGAVSTDASGYINKVKDEQERIRSVAMGKSVPMNTMAPPRLPTLPMQPLLPAQTFDAEAAQETSPRREKAVEVAAEVAS